MKCFRTLRAVLGFRSEWPSDQNNLWLYDQIVLTDSSPKWPGGQDPLQPAPFRQGFFFTEPEQHYDVSDSIGLVPSYLEPAMSSSRLNKALAAIDAANERDPRRVAFEGDERGAEEVYSRRMSRTLGRLYPEASQHLRIAARGQHIERWMHPRSNYPKTRQGYRRWRSALMKYHAGRTGQIVAESGYSTADISRVESPILKRRLKFDAEVQALEDVVCVVFLEDCFADFASKHDDAKVIDILRKTWAKMSPHGREVALTLDLPAASQRLVEAAFA